MSRRLAVARADGPAVIGIQVDVTLSHGNHRLDGDTHAGFQHDAVSAPPVVGHLWVFVHLMTDAMTGQLAHDAIAVGLAVVLHSTADIAQMVTGLCTLDTLVEGFLRGAEQLFHFFAHLADTERVAGVAAEAVEQRTAVDGNDVAVVEHCRVVGHTVNNHIIDRGADAGWERPSIWIGNPLKVGTAPWARMNASAILSNWRVVMPGLICFANSPRVIPTSWLARRISSISSSVFRNIFILKSIGTHTAASVDTAGVEQAIVVAHEQVALYLLQCVEHNTHENQQ